jgi:hypothetical protein
LIAVLIAYLVIGRCLRCKLINANRCHNTSGCYARDFSATTWGAFTPFTAFATLAITLWAFRAFRTLAARRAATLSWCFVLRFNIAIW